VSDDPDHRPDLPSVLNELVRAANRVPLLGDPEKQRLLDLAAYTLKEGRRRVAFSEPENDWDLDEPTFRWRVMSIAVHEHSDDEVQAALLEAAELIRELKIILDAKAEVLGENEREGNA
jgi:hypothetical protein